MTEPLTIILPERPPPLSACYTNAAPRFVKGGGRSKAHIGRKMTKRYAAWITRCMLTVGYVGKVPGPIAVDYQFARVDKRKRDLGNLEKAVSDLLVKMKVIEDDSLIMVLRLRWGGDAPVRITVAPWRGEMG